MKTLIIGTSLSGKSTLANYLRGKKIDCLDIDDQLIKGDLDDKYQDQIPKILADALAQKDIILISNTDYLTLDELRKAKELGFKILQLEITLPELIRRNKINVDLGNEDLTLWLEDNLDFQNELRRLGLVDKSLNASLPVEQIAKEIQ